MDFILQINSFLAGPCLYITLTLCLAGLIRKALIIIEGREQGLKFPVFQTGGEADAPHLTFTGRTPFLAVVSILFHIAVIAAPLTARGHSILLDLSWGILPPRFNPIFTSSLTGLAMVTGIILLSRRIFVKHVLVLSSWRDYAIMICVLVPFVTGMMARGEIGNYEAVMFIHYLGAHILFVSIGWTRLGHFVFFSVALFVTTGFRGREAG
jgi:nitrate reductase gamma subunit